LPDPAPLFRLENVSYGYRWGGGFQSVLRGIDLVVPDGAFTCIVGPSGMGKTTLLGLMGLLDRPQGGKLWLAGDEVGALPERALSDLRLRRLGFVFQAFHLVPTLTALENTAYFLPYLGLSRAQAVRRSEEVLEALGIADMRHKKPLELSGGQRQRVSIARALAKRPNVILADEPTANLDRATAEGIISLFKGLHRDQGVSFVFSTHDLRLVDQADLALTIRDGKLFEGREA
jgi:ABC-type lipoprotein export system ATPase subunit